MKYHGPYYSFVPSHDITSTRMVRLLPRRNSGAAVPRLEVVPGSAAIIEARGFAFSTVERILNCYQIFAAAYKCKQGKSNRRHKGWTFGGEWKVSNRWKMVECR